MASGTRWFGVTVMAGLGLACDGIRVPPAAAVRPLWTVAAPDDAESPATRFAAQFCATLQRHNPDGGSWETCGAYFEPDAAPSTVGQLGQGYRVLAVPGIFGQCVERVVKPFEDAGRHLKSEHDLEIEQVSVAALGSTEYNARQIAAYLDERFSGTDQRPYIVLGYSKGASDVLELLSSDASQRPRVKAVVTFAGSIIGSRLPEGVPSDLLSRVRGLDLGPCQSGDGGGIDSLRRGPRAEALTRLPGGLRTYSIPAVSAEAKTSAILASGWKKLAAYSREQDSQVIHEDAIVPGAAYLGYARADHWAIALPFEHVKRHYPLTPDAAVRRIDRLVNHNRYPRAALVEAALSYVATDLGLTP